MLIHPLCSLCFGSEIKNFVCNSTFYALLRSPMHGRVIAGLHVRCCHMLQYTNFGFYLSLLQIWVYMVVKHQSLKLAMVSCSSFTDTISRTMSKQIIVCCTLFSTWEIKGLLTKEEQHPDHIFRSYYEPNWAMSVDLRTVKFWGKDFTQDTQCTQWIIILMSFSFRNLSSV